MHIIPVQQNINYNTKSSFKEPSFKHGGEPFWKSDYSKKDKLIVAATTATGVFASLAILAKAKGYSLKPRRFLSYLKNTEIKFPQIATMGIGTCLGGLAGGYIIDKNPLNRKAKRRETIMQLGNIIIPIGFVDCADKLCRKFLKKPDSSVGKITKIASCFGAVIAGIFIANFAMNKLANFLFKDKTEQRGVKGTDLFPHVDDVIGSAQYIDETSKVIRYISRIVPYVLMVPGNEIGNKKAY